MATRNMQRIEMNIHEKELCVKLVIYKDYTEMHSQQNIKFLRNVRTTHLQTPCHSPEYLNPVAK